MSEQKTVARPASAAKPSLWDQALKVVKGDNTNDLIEQFTQEMTLVAEGLCEDQARLRKAVDGLIRQAENEHDQNARAHAELSEQLDRQDREITQRLDALTKQQDVILRRLDALEQAKRPAPSKLSFLGGSGTLDRVTLLASIVCGTWLIVTILNLFI